MKMLRSIRDGQNALIDRVTLSDATINELKSNKKLIY